MGINPSIEMIRKECLNQKEAIHQIERHRMIPWRPMSRCVNTYFGTYDRF
jgi:hypothetical protein